MACHCRLLTSPQAPPWSLDFLARESFFFFLKWQTWHFPPLLLLLLARCVPCCRSFLAWTFKPRSRGSSWGLWAFQNEVQTLPQFQRLSIKKK